MSINDKDIKIKEEKNIVNLMIKIYCRGNKHLDPPCDSCSDLIDYVEEKIDICPFMETKTFCSNCAIHCYNDSMQKKIKKVMRYSGPRMIFHHPLMTINHAYQGIKYKIKENKSNKKT